MTAIPIKSNKLDSAVTTLFGKAKWFALVNNNGEINIIKNESESGRHVVEQLVQMGVKNLIFNQMGGNPFMLLQRNGIKCFHSGNERITIPQVMEKLNQNQLTQVDGTNMAQFVEQGNMHNKGRKHDHHDHHDHDHDHHHHDHHHSN